ncbi:hypothetical protein LJB86_05475 [Deltaproteobacteria bacterium OttesenSCG-928-M10]|nr:hypothetical protein [Deltaproteobacteria bacterium OttesenSCG-928-M10]
MIELLEEAIGHIKDVQDDHCSYTRLAEDDYCQLGTAADSIEQCLEIMRSPKARPKR